MAQPRTKQTLKERHGGAEGGGNGWTRSCLPPPLRLPSPLPSPSPSPSPSLSPSPSPIPRPSPEAVQVFDIIEPTASTDMLHQTANEMRKARTCRHPQDVREFPANCAVLASFVQVVAYKAGRLDDARLARAYHTCVKAQKVDKDDASAANAAMDAVADAFHDTS